MTANAALPPLKSVGRQLHTAHSPNYTVAILLAVALASVKIIVDISLRGQFASCSLYPAFEVGGLRKSFHLLS